MLEEDDRRYKSGNRRKKKKDIKRNSSWRKAKIEDSRWEENSGD